MCIPMICVVMTVNKTFVVINAITKKIMYSNDKSAKVG